MTQPPSGDDWVDGDYESGGDPVPNPETGAGMGAGEGSTFEPEEDAPVDEGVDGPGLGTS